MGPVIVGVDIGQAHDPTALCVAERDGARLVVRHLARLPLGTDYPAVGRHIDGLIASLRERTGRLPTTVIDATGVGKPVVDGLWSIGRPVVAVYLTAGGKRICRRRGPRPIYSLGKARMVCRLQAVIQEGRIRLPRTAEARALATELLGYEIRVDEDGHARFGAFRSGTHDDLATALGLATDFGMDPP